MSDRITVESRAERIWQDLWALEPQGRAKTDWENVFKKIVCTQIRAAINDDQQIRLQSGNGSRWFFAVEADGQRLEYGAPTLEGLDALIHEYTIDAKAVFAPLPASADAPTALVNSPLASSERPG